jgi:hypothetical protein
MKKHVLALALAATVIAPSVTAAPGRAPMTPAQVQADPLFTEPYVDIDEWRDGPVRHRYVHGGFKGTDLKFSFYLPDKAQYHGRFFQYVTPVPDSENLAQVAGDDKIGFAISSGGYFVETNGGGTSATAGPAFRADPTIGAFRANAAAAMYSRKIAAEMYGPHRTYGYIYGGSGGAYRTLGSMENTEGVWDGAVPFVIGSPMAAPNGFSVRMHAMRLLKDKFPQIVDAMDAGGSGDPYAGLNPEQAAALHEVTRLGLPPRSWFGYKTMGVHAFTALYGGMVMADPGYFEDFWTKPGYLGFDNPASLKPYRLQFPTSVSAPLSAAELAARGLAPTSLPGQPKGDGRGSADLAWQKLVNDGSVRPAAFELTDAPPDVSFIGGDMFVLSGAAKGKRVALMALSGKVATLGVVDLATLAQIKPGDQVRIDNSQFLAAQTYHRHQVPGPDYPVYDQFRKADGTPLYPQRPMLLGPMFAAGAAGSVPSGHFQGKVIIVESLLDREAFPWQADWYRRKFDGFYGKDAPNRYRVWMTDNALHGYTEDREDPSRTISYLGVLHQALRDVAAWVENGTPPPTNTNYKVVDGQVVVPATAASRQGIQPVVSLSANGSARADVHPGQLVNLAGTITVPPGTGKVVWAHWDLDGSGKFATAATLPARPAAKVNVRSSVSFDKPGTYFVTLKVESERNGDVTSPYARIQNLARVRVVVR